MRASNPCHLLLSAVKTSLLQPYLPNECISGHMIVMYGYARLFCHLGRHFPFCLLSRPLQLGTVAPNLLTAAELTKDVHYGRSPALLARLLRTPSTNSVSSNKPSRCSVSGPTSTYFSYWRWRQSESALCSMYYNSVHRSRVFIQTGSGIGEGKKTLENTHFQPGRKHRVRLHYCAPVQQLSNRFVDLAG